MLSVRGFPPLSAAANALSTPPGEYGRKDETKGIDGGPHKRWSMRFNSKQREEPYQVSTSSDNPRIIRPLRGRVTGGAWLSSARVVRCWVKSNERNNSYLSCQHSVGHSKVTAGDKPEEGGMRSNHHAPYDLGYTRATMDRTKGSKTARLTIAINCSSSDCSRYLTRVKLESLVIGAISMPR